jgi:hypothetical protein
MMLEAEGVTDTPIIGTVAAEHEWTLAKVIDQLALTVEDLTDSRVHHEVSRFLRRSRGRRGPQLGSGAADPLDGIRDILPQVR